MPVRRACARSHLPQARSAPLGLWVQNVGVKGAGLPTVVRERAPRHSYGLPEPMEAWTWTSVVDVEEDEWLEFDELDDLVLRAAGEANAASLGFAVIDSDSVYLVGADPSGIRFHLLVNEDAFEDEHPPQDAEGAAAWAADHAPASPSAEEIVDVLSRDFVFAEEGLDVLFARMGLLPAVAARGAEELTAAELEEEGDLWERLDAVTAPESRRLERGRWYATLEYRGTSGYVLAAEEEGFAIVLGTGVPGAVREALDQIGISGGGVAAFVVRSREDVGELGQLPSRDMLRHELASQGATLGDWGDVPDEVPRDLASTAAWVTSRPGS